MDISTRTMVAMLAATIVLVVAAVALTVAAQGRGPMAAPVHADGARVYEVLPTVVRQGGRDIDPAGPLVVRVDGTTSSTVLLVCEPFKSERPLRRGAVVFPSVPLGDCTLRLDGATRAYGPVFPGDELRCRVAEANTACTGGLAAGKAARVTITSDIPGELYVDDDLLGALPLVDQRLKVGTRRLRVAFGADASMVWRLSLKPEETVAIHFPIPPGVPMDTLVPPLGAPPPEPVTAPAAPRPAVSHARPAPEPDPVLGVDDTNGTAMAIEVEPAGP